MQSSLHFHVHKPCLWSYSIHLRMKSCSIFCTYSLLPLLHLTLNERDSTERSHRYTLHWYNYRELHSIPKIDSIEEPHWKTAGIPSSRFVCQHNCSIQNRIYRLYWNNNNWRIPQNERKKSIISLSLASFNFVSWKNIANANELN